MPIVVAVGDPIPLFVAVEDEATNYVVKAQIFRRNSYAQLYSDVSLSYIAASPGHYANNTINMPTGADFVDVIYEVYDNDGVTLIAKSEELFQPLLLSPVNFIGQPVVGTVVSESVLTGSIVSCQ